MNSILRKRRAAITRGFRNYGISAVVVALIGASGAAAESDDTPRSLAAQVIDRPSEIVGSTVLDGQEREVGEVQSVVVAKQGCTFYLVLSSDQFLGLGDDDLLVPVTAVSRKGDDVLLTSTEAVQPYARQGYLIVEEDD